MFKDQSAANFIDPDLLRSVKGIEFLAKKAVDNFKLGVHKSLLSGIGIEFSQLHQYQPGDDIRNIDWKKFARSERLYIRQAELESHLELILFVDCSGSMNYAENGMSKLAFAKYIASCVGWLGVEQRDRLSILPLKNNAMSDTQSNNGRSAGPEVFKKLVELKASLPLETCSWKKAFFKKENAISIVLTDLWQEEEEMQTWLKFISTASSETILFHIKAVKEFNLDFPEKAIFQHLESREKIFVNSKQIRVKYKKSLENYLATWQNWLSVRNIQYHPVWINESPSSCIYTFIKQRNQYLR